MLDRLSPRPGARKPPKRVARGPGGKGHKTAGRGAKGQGHRSAGRETPLYSEGGQMPLVRRLPKRGFHRRDRVENRVVNLGALAVFGEGARVDPEALVARGLVRRRGGPVKVLGEGDPPARLSLAVHKISDSARRKVEAAGGSVEILG